VDLNNLLRDLELGPRLPAAAAGKRAVAVLPFKLLSANAEDEYLSVALADAVISHLGTSDQLLVRPTSTVMRYAKQASDPLLAARELNVQTIVEGSIQKLGTRLRVHVQAWNAADGSTLLSAKHDAEMDDLFRLQDRISDGLARAFGVRAPAAETAAAPPTKNPRAYELFLRAVERLSRWNRWDTRTAIEMLENATRLDPSFAEAWARLAEARRQLAIHFEPGNARLLQQAEREIRRALALDPANADAHCIRGRLLWTPTQRFQHQAALRAMTDALEFNPGCHQAHVERGCILFHVGLHDEAREDLTEALAAHPDDVSALAYLGITAVYAGDYDEAQHYHDRALSLEPSHLWANLFGIFIVLYRQQLDRAEQEIHAAGLLMGDDPMLTSLEALLWAKRGEERKANRALQRALRSKKSLVHTHHTLHNAAAVCALLDKPAQAVVLLRKAGRIGLPNFPAFETDPHFEPLRKHSQFVRLLSELKREWEGYRREFGRA
jgi:TolB-like protein/lipoprotein NlpI